MIWALDGQVASLAPPSSPAHQRRAGERRAGRSATRPGIPVTAAAGRSGVCGASVPVHGGVVLDLCGLTGIVDVDDTSLVLDVAPGTFGDLLEHQLRADHGVTLGHWPQSVALSTVGGWLACRSAGQLSTRYGKIEDMVLGLDVALADGRRPSPPAARRPAAVGPDLTQLFVGSEGTLGDHHRRPAAAPPRARPRAPRRLRLRLVRGRRRRHAPHPAARRHPRGPAPLRPRRGGPQLPHRRRRACCWCSTRATAPWSTHDGARRRGLPRRRPRRRRPRGALARAPQRRRRPRGAHQPGVRGRHDGGGRPLARPPRASTPPRSPPCSGVEGTVAASAHQSHSYPEGGCLYFTFAAKVEPDDRDRVLPRRVGRRLPGRPRRGRGALAPPRRRPQPQPLRGRGARGRPSTCWWRPSRPSTRRASSTPASSGCPPPSAPRATDARPRAAGGGRPAARGWPWPWPSRPRCSRRSSTP